MAGLSGGWQCAAGPEPRGGVRAGETPRGAIRVAEPDIPASAPHRETRFWPAPHGAKAPSGWSVRKPQDVQTLRMVDKKPDWPACVKAAVARDGSNLSSGPQKFLLRPTDGASGLGER